MKYTSETIANILDEEIELNDCSSFIVSGGSSPVEIFRDLSKINIKWSHVTISLVDDRVVDKSHQDSNEKLVNDLLMVSEAKSAKFISIFNESKQLLNIHRPYSVMLLGMGEDGHFASLFPQLIQSNPEYFDLSSDPEIFFTKPMGNPCHKRASMNLSMILESKNIFLLVSSKNKMDVLNQAKHDNSLPLYYLLNQDKTNIEIIKDF